MRVDCRPRKMDGDEQQWTGEAQRDRLSAAFLDEGEQKRSGQQGRSPAGGHLAQPRGRRTSAEASSRSADGPREQQQAGRHRGIPAARLRLPHLGLRGWRSRGAGASDNGSACPRTTKGPSARARPRRVRSGPEGRAAGDLPSARANTVATTPTGKGHRQHREIPPPGARMPQPSRDPPRDPARGLFPEESRPIGGSPVRARRVTPTRARSPCPERAPPARRDTTVATRRRGRAPPTTVRAAPPAARGPARPVPWSARPGRRPVPQASQPASLRPRHASTTRSPPPARRRSATCRREAWWSR